MLDVTISWTADLIHQVIALPLADIPKPSEGENPPGFEEFQKLLGWAKWGALFCCVAGFMLVGARMGIQHKRGEAGGHMTSLFIVGFACVVIASSVLIVDQLVTGDS